MQAHSVMSRRAAVTATPTGSVLRVLVLVVAALLALEAQVWAASGIPVRLEYEAPSACPRAPAFLELVRERTPEIHAADAGQPAYVARVVLEAEGEDPPQFRGQLQLVDLEGNAARRDLAGATCMDLARACALVISLDLAGREPPPATLAPSPTTGAPEAPQPPQPAPMPEDRPHWEYIGVATGGIRGAVSPLVAPSVSTAFELRRASASSLFAPALRITALHAWSAASSASGTMFFRQWLGAVDGCPLRLRSARERFVIMPCLRVEVGIHLAEIERGGTGVRSGPWLAPGLLGRARARVLGPLFVEAEGGALAPLSRNRFFPGDSGSPTFTVPSVSWFAGLGAGLSFP